MTQDLVTRGVPFVLYRKVEATKPEGEKKPRETREMRMARWTKTLDKIPEEDLAQLEAIMESFVQERFGKVFVEEARLLNQDEVDLMAAEYKDMVFISGALEARKEAMKKMVFTHINVENADSQDVPPEFTKGAVVSEKEGIAFKREGGNQGDPIILWDGIKSALPADKWEKIIDREIIPEEIVDTPNPEKLLDLVESGDIDIEFLRPFIEPGPYSPVKFVPRPIT